jgi:hypothetical protein
MARKRQEAAASGTMSLEQRLAHYRTGGRNELTPRQLRRAAHKAKISTLEVLQRSRKG